MTEPVAVVDDAARRRQRLDLEAVALRKLCVALVLDDLQLDEPPDQEAGQEQHDDSGRDQARQEQALLLPMVLERYGRSAHG